MPVVNLTIGKGRSTEQKRAVAKDITEAIVKNLNVTPDMVTILINELEQEHIAKSGQLMSDLKKS